MLRFTNMISPYYFLKKNIIKRCCYICLRVRDEFIKIWLVHHEVHDWQILVSTMYTLGPNAYWALASLFVWFIYLFIFASRLIMMIFSWNGSWHSQIVQTKCSFFLSSKSEQFKFLFSDFYVDLWGIIVFNSSIWKDNNQT